MDACRANSVPLLRREHDFAWAALTFSCCAGLIAAPPPRKPAVNRVARPFGHSSAEFADQGIAMTGAEVLDLGREAIWVTVLVAAGPMLVGLVVGLVVSLLQTLTQIQE